MTSPWKRLVFAGRTNAETVLAVSGETHPPVDVRRIASGLGVPVQYAPKAQLDGASGVLVVSPGASYIHVAMEDSNVRQRFTIAHELGHLLLHVDPNAATEWRDTRFAGSSKEVEANKWAADLLMPRSMLVPLKNRGHSASYLAHIFDVSLAAMEIRLQSL